MKQILILLSVTFLWSCVKPLDVPEPAFVRKVVLLGILQPSNNITVSLHYNLKADSKDSLYPVVKDAFVKFYEDNRLIGTAKDISRDGLYFIDYFPKQGYTYKVVAEIPNFGIVEAAEVMPTSHSINVQVSERKENNPNRNPDITVGSTQRIGSNAHWFSVYMLLETFRTKPQYCFNRTDGQILPECVLAEILAILPNIFTTNSTFIDRFNAFYDSGSGAYTYSRFMRLDNAKISAVNNFQFTFSLRNSTPKRSDKGEAIYLRYLIMGRGLDLYFKSALAANYNRPADAYGNINNPFAEPIPIYSNIKNGIGVWGGMIETEYKIPALP